MSELQTTTLTALHAAILAAMKAQFGSRIRQYGAYEPERTDTDTPTQIETPALLLSLDTLSAETGARPDGSIGITCRWVLFAALSHKTDAIHLQLAELSAEVMAVVLAHPAERPFDGGNHWGLGLATEDPTGLSSSTNTAGLNGRASRLLEWTQVAYLQVPTP